jgi:hypothetical protein
VWLDPGEPWLNRVSLDDLILDMSAKELTKMRFCGHRYRADYEKVMDEPGYDKKVKAKLTPTSKTSIDSPERASDIAAGIAVDDDELKDMIWLMDLWIPGNRTIATFAVGQEELAPLIERTLEVCRRLLDAHGVDRAALDRVVLVGGPTAMPLVRRLVAERVGALAAEALDPMTLVAQGAALAATHSGLDARPLALATSTALAVKKGAHALQIKAPTLSTDLLPFCIVRVVDTAAPGAPLSMRVVRTSAGRDTWASPWVTRDADDAFAMMCELESRRGNVFSIEAKDAAGHLVPTSPSTFSIIHGVTIGDPPVSRTIGVALANNAVRVYFEKGSPLPATRTFMHHTIETATPGMPGPALRIPLVQGELEEAHLCRLIGAIEVDGRDLDVVVPANTAVEVTLETAGHEHVAALAAALAAEGFEVRPATTV